jgi:hypothetical protein
MCCLGYESRVYEEFKRGLPRIGEKVRVRDGVGRVRKHNIFEDAFTVELEGGEFVKVPKRDWSPGRRPDGAAAGDAGESAAAAEPPPAPAASGAAGGRQERPERGARRRQGGRRPERGGSREREDRRPPGGGQTAP